MDGNEEKELRTYIEALGEVVRRYPRKGDLSNGDGLY